LRPAACKRFVTLMPGLKLHLAPKIPHDACACRFFELNPFSPEAGR
jgi:hypothetical protein